MHGSVEVGCAASPQTIHDHPSEHLYSFRYPAKGNIDMSRRVAQHLNDGGFSTSLVEDRGLDHGAWLALELLFPDAPLPVVPVSVPAGSDATTLMRFGTALAALRAEGVVVICSGAATHNQDRFRSQFLSRRLRLGGDDVAVSARRVALLQAEATVATDAPASVAFDQWLTETLACGTHEERAVRLQHVHKAPGAVDAHPEPSHWQPVLIFAGTAAASDGGASKIASGFQYGLSMSSFCFEGSSAAA